MPAVTLRNSTAHRKPERRRPDGLVHVHVAPRDEAVSAPEAAASRRAASPAAGTRNRNAPDSIATK